MNNSSFTKIIFLSLAIFFASTLAFSQTPSATPPKNDDDVVKISTTLIQLDVIVTDKKGNQVTDLKPEDFKIYENGKQQDISNFSYIFRAVMPQIQQPVILWKSRKSLINIPFPHRRQN